MLDKLKPEIDQLLTETPGTWGIVIQDLAADQSIQWNAEEPFYAASMIKVPIMASAFLAAWEGEFSLEATIPLSKEVQVGGCGVLQHMTPGSEITIRDLITLMIIQSDNTATNMIIDLLGTERIRQTMIELEMRNSQFYNKLMVVPAKLEGSNTITAADMGACFRNIARGNIVSYHRCQDMLDILKKQQVRDGLPIYLPSDESPVIGMLPQWELANKTGMVTNIQHDGGILYMKEQAFLIITLTRGCVPGKAKATMGKIARLIYDNATVETPDN